MGEAFLTGASSGAEHYYWDASPLPMFTAGRMMRGTVGRLAFQAAVGVGLKSAT